MASSAQSRLNPFNANDLAAADAGIASGEQILQYWRTCTHCNVDVSAMIAQTEALIDFYRKLKEHFMSGANV